MPVHRRSQRASVVGVLDPRDRILQAALEEFAARGFEGARMREIALAAHVNLGLLQYYFGGKERLWKAAVDAVFERLWLALATLAERDLSDPDELAEMVRTAVRFAARNPALVRLMNDEGQRSSRRLQWLVDRHGRRLYDTAAHVVQRARGGGVLADVAPIHLYYIFIGAIGMIFSQSAECRRLVGVDPTQSEAMIEAHSDAVIRFVLQRPQAPRAVRERRRA